MSKPAEHFFVTGIVAARDKMPYIQLANENRMVAQLTMAQAHQIALDILVMAARTEADAMLLKFFKRSNFPDGAAGHLMVMFRDFRAELDAERTERI
jgi:hypothetical protein